MTTAGCNCWVRSAKLAGRRPQSRYHAVHPTAPSFVGVPPQRAQRRAGESARLPPRRRLKAGKRRVAALERVHTHSALCSRPLLILVLWWNARGSPAAFLQNLVTANAASADCSLAGCAPELTFRPLNTQLKARRCVRRDAIDLSSSGPNACPGTGREYSAVFGQHHGPRLPSPPGMSADSFPWHDRNHRIQEIPCHRG